ncbi:MAG: hypothetical protein WAW52_07775 [Methanothrix sp.]
MSRYSPYFRRLQWLEPTPKYVEPWPPEEGTLEWAMMESLKDDGLDIPDKPANESGFMFLARLEAPRLWGDYHAPD